MAAQARPQVLAVTTQHTNKSAQMAQQTLHKYQLQLDVTSWPGTGPRRDHVRKFRERVQLWRAIPGATSGNSVHGHYSINCSELLLQGPCGAARNFEARVFDSQLHITSSQVIASWQRSIRAWLARPGVTVSQQQQCTVDVVYRHISAALNMVQPTGSRAHANLVKAATEVLMNSAQLVLSASGCRTRLNCWHAAGMQ